MSTKSWNQILSELINELLHVNPINYKETNLFHKKARLYIKEIFGEESNYFKEWSKIEIPIPDTKNTPAIRYYQTNKWEPLKDKMHNLLAEMHQELRISTELKTIKVENKITKQTKESGIFIVHGTDHKPVEELKEILKCSGLSPMVLEDLPCGSKTIVEKLEMYSDVDFAFVILTPDDVGSRYLGKEHNSESFEKLNLRARQNVILEFGFFIGKLGREKVCYLVKGKVDIPSDMSGIAYIQFNDSLQEIKQKILNELEEIGLISFST